MEDTAWFLVIGLLLTAMALAGSVLKRAPVSAAMFYLAAGYAIGPAGLGLIGLGLPAGARIVERVAGVAVLVSLFTAGLKLRVPRATAAGCCPSAWPWSRWPSRWG